jgi:hypothetical protein
MYHLMIFAGVIFQLNINDLYNAMIGDGLVRAVESWFKT